MNYCETRRQIKLLNTFGKLTFRDEDLRDPVSKIS
jgi:hypothetical protein